MKSTENPEICADLVCWRLEALRTAWVGLGMQELKWGARCIFAKVHESPQSKETRASNASC